MSTAYSADISGQRIEVEIVPPTNYSPPVLSIRQQFGTFQLHADPEQLAEVEYAIRTYLEGIRYPETPDQQMILHAECVSAIEEVIA
ncbi:hypothetical protein A3844_01890 [Paenibacillus helianthi]|uniref:Uncharacterized protein n=1 Tax=Paenibacillus helianthi TaxID=1349432 RepID=A0ABX3EY04_9BACL|nr:hypothetical protein [Paenibacillus helianthi]OKP91889.1 hypothetical protein A3844_01890 [Paenibacillus helianthi]